MQEFGAITGVFMPDAITQTYIAHLKLKVNRSNSLYFQPDKGTIYAGTFEIGLSKVESTIAVYPSPDNVVPVSEKFGLDLDDVFIGACTTTEEELILAALVLQIGLKENLPIKTGKRRVTPGSLPIVDKLRSLGLLDVYEAAGFTRGVPGCSYCIAMTADQASPGEVWLSSQNRNFKNRMGRFLVPVAY
jgi:homoaconitase/3-isopropylmalate dehydratase large subunit